MKIAAIWIVFAVAAAAAPPTIERPEREDTIYVLHGATDELEAFTTRLGDWEGGELIAKDLEAGTYTFWAYSERTASQARQFIMPAVFSGLVPEMLEYHQEAAFPQERAILDEIAIACRLNVDPFFISPSGEVEFRPPVQSDPDAIACAMESAKDAPLINARFVVARNEDAIENRGE